MYSQRYPYFNRFTKSYNILQFVDLYDKDSFIREYILDNVFVCIFMYILFYFAIWYAHKVIKRVEKKNQEMLVTVEKNRSRIDGIIALKNKREEYEEIVIKAKGAQKVMTIQLVNEMKRLDGEVAATNTKLNELEKFLAKWKIWRNCTERSSRKFTGLETDGHETPDTSEDPFENIKILEPSFPPPTPPEPPPRKFGVFARPPVPSSPPPKIGFK